MPTGVRVAVGIGWTALERALLGAGLRKRRDGWRRATGLLLRGEASTFVLSAFGLRAWQSPEPPAGWTVASAEAEVARRLREFLDGEPACRVGVRHGELEDRVEPAPRAQYTLRFEPAQGGAARFVMPARWGGEPAPGPLAPLFEVCCRVDGDARVDVWLRINHVAADGVPMQEVLGRLERAWGGAEEVRFPAPEEFEEHARARPIAGAPTGAPLAELQTFVDFAPLVAWRKRMNAAIGESMTLSAALLWSLARHEAFGDLAMGTTVEVAATGHLDRAVGVVVVRPCAHADDARGLTRYVRDFNRQTEATRRRASGGCGTLDAAAFVPARFAAPLLRHALERVPSAFGTLGLTMLKDARVFGAPLAEVGHRHGFIAVGSVGLPTSDGRMVGSVTVKGPRDVIARYPRALAEVMRSAAGS